MKDKYKDLLCTETYTRRKMGQWEHEKQHGGEQWTRNLVAFGGNHKMNFQEMAAGIRTFMPWKESDIHAETEGRE